MFFLLNIRAKTQFDYKNFFMIFFTMKLVSCIKFQTKKIVAKPKFYGKVKKIGSNKVFTAFFFIQKKCLYMPLYIYKSAADLSIRFIDEFNPVKNIVKYNLILCQFVK